MALSAGEIRIPGVGVTDADGRQVLTSTDTAGVKFAVINANTITELTVVAAVSGKSIRLLNYTVIAAGVITLTWKSGTTARSGPLAFAANGGVAPVGPILQTAVGEALVLSTNAAVQIGGHIAYVEV